MSEQDKTQPVAWIRFCSDGSYEGPIADCDRRMDGVRRTSGAWTPLYAAPLPLTNEQVDKLRREYGPQSEDEHIGFLDGVRAAERAHGIKDQP